MPLRPRRRASSRRSATRATSGVRPPRARRDARAGAGRADRHHRSSSAEQISRHQQGHHGRVSRRSTNSMNGGPIRIGVPVADGRGRLRAADRVRERRQPAAVALGEPRARDRACASRSARRAGASSGSCWSRACCSPSSAASSGSASPRRHPAVRSPPRRTSAGRTGFSSRWTRIVFAFFAADLPGHRHPVRPGAGAARVEDRRQRGPEGRRPHAAPAACARAAGPAR